MISEYQRRIKEARRSVSPKNVQEMEGRVKLISLEFNRLTGTPCQFFCAFPTYVVIPSNSLQFPPLGNPALKKPLRVVGVLVQTLTLRLSHKHLRVNRFVGGNFALDSLQNQ